VTCEVAGWSVVQVMVAPVVVIAEDAMLVMTGATVNVAKVESVDVLVPPGLLVD
jgi:hypothetical protein